MEVFLSRPVAGSLSAAGAAGQPATPAQRRWTGRRPRVQVPRAVLHLIKLAVGVRDVAHLREIQARRARTDPPLRHQTRMAPRRAAEITGGGGSLFWVIAGFVQVRQRILEVREERWDDGTACAGLVLDPALVPVAARPVKPFQGWRYLSPEAAPEDLRGTAGAAQGAEALPARLRQELQALGLL
jgi:hypothetical protein